MRTLMRTVLLQDYYDLNMLKRLNCSNQFLKIGFSICTTIAIIIIFYSSFGKANL